MIVESHDTSEGNKSGFKCQKCNQITEELVQCGPKKINHTLYNVKGVRSGLLERPPKNKPHLVHILEEKRRSPLGLYTMWKRKIYN